jgi:hypothetical protein
LIGFGPASAHAVLYVRIDCQDTLMEVNTLLSFGLRMVSFGCAIYEKVSYRFYITLSLINSARAILVIISLFSVFFLFFFFFFFFFWLG